MKRKWKWIMIGFFTLIFIGAAFLYLIPPNPDTIVCARIKKGMTENQVVAILGKSGGWQESPESVTKHWSGKRGFIHVDFDLMGTVMEVTYSRYDGTVLEHIRDWLSW